MSTNIQSPPGAQPTLLKKDLDDTPADLMGLEPETPTKPIISYLPEPVKTNLVELTQKAGDAIQKAQCWTQKKVPVVKEFYVKTIEPKVRPVVQFAKEKHSQYPSAITLTVAIIALFYGGCFPRLVLFYAAYQVAGTKSVLKKVYEFYREAQEKIPSEVQATGEKIAVFFKTTHTQKFIEIVSDICKQFCMIYTTLYCGVAGTLAMGVVLGNELGMTMRRPIVGQLKTVIKTEGGRKWVPFLSGTMLSVTCAFVVNLMPSFAASMIAACPASFVICTHAIPHLPANEMTSNQTRFLSLLVAFCAVVYQMFCYYAFSGGIFSTVIQICVYPVILCERLL